MKIKSVAIDNVVFDIKETKDDIIVDNHLCVGSIAPDTGEILISDNIGENVKPLVLMHEVVHALFDSRGYKELSTDEDIVESMARVILGFIRYNPDVIKYLIDSGKKQ